MSCAEGSEASTGPPAACMLSARMPTERRCKTVDNWWTGQASMPGPIPTESSYLSADRARWFWLPPWQPYNPWPAGTGGLRAVTTTTSPNQVDRSKHKAMLDALTAGYRPAIPGGDAGNAPDALAVMTPDSRPRLMRRLRAPRSIVSRARTPTATCSGWRIASVLPIPDWRRKRPIAGTYKPS
jgi:hypothetical protein